MKWKKLLSGLLVAAMTFSLAACGGGDDGGQAKDNTGDAVSGTEAGENTGGAENGDMPVVKAALLGMLDTTDAPLVREEINKILGERYGIQCELTFISRGSWQQQSNLLLTGSDVDVLAYFGLPLNTYVTNGQCLPGMLANVTQTIDVYVYKGLTQLNDVGRSSAAGFYQSVVGFLMVLAANLIVRKIDKESALF